MKAEDIRAVPDNILDESLKLIGSVNNTAASLPLCQNVYQGIKVWALSEIASQLAEHNAHMERIEFLLENVININCGGLQVKVNE